ncbi:hypothetical protein OH77DRAFT_1518780 [Trametes cingulata]|nr:hypothetical protein OH77DRAFT_1518780 [Trametes cingulata]
MSRSAAAAEEGQWYPPIIDIGGGESLSQASKQWRSPRVASNSPADSSDLGNRSKLRKVDRACDYCRKRKSKCDGRQRKNNICSACEAESRVCTYLEDSKPRGPPKAYINALERRMAKAEALIRRLSPQLDLTAELGCLPSSDGWKSESTSRQPTPCPSSTRPRSAGDMSFSPASSASGLVSSPELSTPSPPLLQRNLEGSRRRKRTRASSEPTTPIDSNESPHSHIFYEPSASGLADDIMLAFGAGGEQSILGEPVRRWKGSPAMVDRIGQALPIDLVHAETEGLTMTRNSPLLFPTIDPPGTNPLPRASSSNNFHVPTPMRHERFDGMMFPELSALYESTSGHVSPDPPAYGIDLGAGSVWPPTTDPDQRLTFPVYAPGQATPSPALASSSHSTGAIPRPVSGYGLLPGTSNSGYMGARIPPLLERQMFASHSTPSPNPQGYHSPSPNAYYI